jgi:tetratricopeptide (TPR) repeat protein
MAMVVQSPSICHGIAIDTLDSEGMPLSVDKEVLKSPEEYLKVMETEFEKGNLDSIRFLGEQLDKAKKINSDLRALYSISLASMGDIAGAEKQLAAVAGDQVNELYRLCAQAMLLKAKGHTADALKVCDKAIAAPPPHPYPYNIRGRIYLAMGQTKNALAAFQKAIDINPGFLPAYANLGALYYLDNNYSKSIQFFSEGLKRNPGSFNIHFGLALSMEAAGDLKGALRHCRESLKIKPLDSQALSQTADLEIKNALYDDALKTARFMEQQKLPGASAIIADAALHLNDLPTAKKYIEAMNDQDLSKQYLKGYLDLLQSNYPEAQSAMEKVLEADTNHFGAFATLQTIKLYLSKPVELTDAQIQKWGTSPAALLSLIAGTLDASQGNWQGALKRWNNAAEVFSGFSMAGITVEECRLGLKPEEMKHLGLGSLFYYRNFFTHAASEFNKAIEKNPSSFLSNYFSGHLNLKNGNKKNSARVFEEATEKAPRFFSALYVAGELQATMGNFDRALSFYNSAFQVQNDMGLAIKIGLLYEMKNQFADAAKMYEKAIELSPENFIGYNQLAWLYAKQGRNLDQALTLAAKADKLQPGNASIQDTLGWIYYQKKEFGKARPYLEAANNTNPDDPTILYHLGAVYHASGQTAKAKEVLGKALAKSNSFEGAENAKQLLLEIK